MAGEQLVDASYRGIVLGQGVRLASARGTPEDPQASDRDDGAAPLEHGRGSAFLELDAPVPVGTEIAITTSSKLVIPARVQRVYEQHTGNEGPAGMCVSTMATGTDAVAWWNALLGVVEAAPQPASGDHAQAAAAEPEIQPAAATATGADAGAEAASDDAAPAGADTSAASGSDSPAEAEEQAEAIQSGSGVAPLEETASSEPNKPVAPRRSGKRGGASRRRPRR